MKTVVAMTMKDASEAKTRLAVALSPPSRMRLALSLFTSSHEFFEKHLPAFTRLVVTPSNKIAQLAAAAGAEVLKEDSAAGLNVAAARASHWAHRAGFDRLLLVPADIPVWLRGEVDMLLQHGNCATVTIARAHDGGTNALLIDLRRVKHFEFQYGIDSAKRHQQWCRAAGISCTIANLPFISRDVDTPEDYLLLSRSRPAISHS